MATTNGGEGRRKPLGPQADGKGGSQSRWPPGQALALLAAPLGRSLASSAVPSATVPWSEAGVTHGPVPRDLRKYFWMKKK